MRDALPPIEGRVLDADEALALSSGAVKNPEAFNYATRVPERGGLQCAEIFGPADWSAIAGDPSADVRRDRWGHVALDEPLAHPLRGDAVLVCLLVVPPYFRRWTLVPAELSRERAWRRRAQILATDERELGDPPEKVLFEEGLAQEADINALGVTWEEHPLNALYRAIVNRNNRLRRLRQLNAPADVLAHEGDDLTGRMDSLFRELVARREELGEANLLRALCMGRGERSEPAKRS
jgi:DNA-directed RNA polymerase subunit beta'